MILHPLDIIAIIAYLSLCVLIGIKVGGKPGDATSYFTSKGKVPWWAVSFSIVATETSMLTVISIPAVAYLGSLVFLQLVAGYVIGRMFVAWIMLPQYFTGEQKTAYSFFQDRFGSNFRRAISGTFLSTRLLADGVRLFAAAIPIKVITGLDYPTSILIIASLTLAYTYYGGLKSVIWIDVLQLFVYLFGGFFIISWIISGDFGNPLSSLANDGKLIIIQLPTSISDVFFTPYNLIGAVIGGVFLTLASHGTDHLIIQRLLACGNLKNARKALVSSALFVMIQFALFLTAGLMLYLFYSGASVDELGVTNSDEIILKFIAEEVPSGIAGLIIAGLFAAAMSTLSSSLSALSSTTLFDIFPRLSARPDAMRISRLLMVVWTVVFYVFAVSFTSTDNPIVELGLGIAGFTYGGLLGAFFIGRFTNFSTTSAFAGLFACISGMAIIIFNFGIAWPWYTSIGITIYFIVAAGVNGFTVLLSKYRKLRTH
ncbi:MAG: sodium:solute symporter [Bacteroidetes bacterium]|nr:sodium:solute symporter [Bacteroidota bacterium]MCH8522989.1 sodium:solute symporter [Balneolales bacterium]